MEEQITAKKIHDLAERLMFSLSEEEAGTLQKEFDVVLKQMDLIGEIDGINDNQPMTFPYVDYNYELREDVAEESLSHEDLFKNTKEVKNNEIKVPKVVE